MDVNLTDELENCVRSKLESGEYGSASEVVCEALREKLQEERRTEIERRLQTFVTRGIDLGPPFGVSKKEWDELRLRAAASFSRKIETALAQLDRGEGIPGQTVAARLRAATKRKSA